jgi:hypothetical protein
VERSVRRPPQDADRPIPELLQKLADETTTLVREEVQLARAEIVRTLDKAKDSAVAFGVAAIFALGAIGALTAALIAAIATVLPVWAAALIISVIYGAVAAMGVQMGRASLKRAGSPVPEQTIRTLKDDTTAIRSAARRGR